ncbi:hypothetical protein [Nocardiopsis alba]|uniref:hypothetical protein n=1 Tax=Nocardiopsis alba TaxID=53437 RepID=UPI0033A9A8DF
MSEASKPEDVITPATETKPETKANDFDSLPAWAQEQIRTLRSESAEKRTSAKTNQEQLEALQRQVAQALGLEDTPTVESLQERLQTSQKQAQDQAQEFAVYKASLKHGVDAESLLDSMKFRKRLEAGEDLESLVLEHKPKEVQEEKPEKKSSKSGADFNGSTSKPHVFTPEEIKAMSPEEFSKHREAILKQQLGK